MIRRETEQRTSRKWEHRAARQGELIVQRAKNDPVFALGFALRGTELGLD
jgi:hypothetical protein